MDFVLKTERLTFREHSLDDFEAIRAILGDPEVMYAWEHGFDDDEVRSWIERNIARYQADGFGYWSAFETATGELVALIGLITEEIEGEKCIGLGYIVARKHWGRGLALEGAKGCLKYAKELGIGEITCDIRPQNSASLLVAKRLNMVYSGCFVKEYNGMALEHLIFKKNI